MIKKKLKECWDYDEKFGNLALARVELDYDDGVKYNYRKPIHFCHSCKEYRAGIRVYKAERLWWSILQGYDYRIFKAVEKGKEKGY